MSIVRIFHLALAGQDISGAMERARDSLQKYEERKLKPFLPFSNTEFVEDLDLQRTMIIFESILTAFEASLIF